jgi:hypothetical protein
MRRSIPLRPRTETYPTPEPIAPKTTRKSSIQMLHSPHLAGFRLTDNGASNNIFTEDRSALKVKTNTNILTRSGPAPLEPSYINLLNKSKSREFAVSINIPFKISRNNYALKHGSISVSMSF